MVNNDDISKLYSAMVKSGYNVADLGGSEDKFREYMSNDKMRKDFYGWASKNPKGGFRIGNYDSYEARMTGSLVPKTETGKPVVSETPADKSDYTFTAAELEIGDDKPKAEEQNAAKTPQKTRHQEIFGSDKPMLQKAAELAFVKNDGSLSPLGKFAQEMGDFALGKGRVHMDKIFSEEGPIKLTDRQQKLMESGMPGFVVATDPIFYKDNGKLTTLGAFSQSTADIIAGAAVPIVDWIRFVGEKHPGLDMPGLEKYRKNLRDISDEGFNKINVIRKEREYLDDDIATDIATLLPQVGAYILSFLTGNPSFASAAVATQTVSTMGHSALDAKEAGAGGGQIFASAILDGAIEFLSEKIPLSRWMGKIPNPLAKTVVSEATEKALQKEGDMLLGEVRKELGDKFTVKTVKEFAKDAFAEGGSEAVAEFAQTFTPLIYNPDKYPTINALLGEAYDNARDGFVGGLLMSAMLSPTANYAQRKANDNRRREQGYVEAALVKDEKDNVSVVELIGKSEDGKYMAMRDNKVFPVEKSDIVEKQRFSYEDYRNAKVVAMRTEGYNATDDVAPQIKTAYDMERERAVATFGEDVVAQLDNDPVGTLAGMNEVDREEAMDYVNARVRYEGMIDRFNEQRDSEIAEAVKEVDVVMHEDGNVYMTTLPSTGEDIFITGGKVVLDNEGYIDVNQSEGLVALMPNGKKEAIQAGNIREKVSVENAEAKKAAKSAEIDNRYKSQLNTFVYSDGMGDHTVQLIGRRGNLVDVIVDGRQMEMGAEEFDNIMAEVTGTGKVEGEGGNAPGNGALSPAFETQERKGGTITLHTRTEEKNGVKTTKVVAMRNGSEVSMPTAAFPVPEGVALPDIPEGVEVIGVKELREGDDGKTSATVFYRDKDGVEGTMETKVVPAESEAKTENAVSEADAPGQSGVAVQEATNEAQWVVYDTSGDVASVVHERDGKIVEEEIYTDGRLAERRLYNDKEEVYQTYRYNEDGSVTVDVNLGAVRANEKQQARFADHAKAIAEGVGGTESAPSETDAPGQSGVEKTTEDGNVVLYSIAEDAMLKDKGAEAFERATKVTMDAVERLKANGLDIEVVSQEEADAMAELAEMQKRKSPETALPEDESSFKGTVISSDDGANILKDIDNAIAEYENKENSAKTFIGDVARILRAVRHGSKSEYADIVTANGIPVRIRLADHNVKVSNYDNAGINNGISIVISRKPNTGITNDGDAHLVEFFYSDKKISKADGKPLVEILKSIKQALYSGEYKDNTGLAQREEVNIPEMMTVFHGSGAKFDKFDHSFMNTGEGAQAFGWGTYVTEVEGVGRTYATTMRDKLISEKHKENAIINKLAKQTLESSNGNKEEALDYLRGLLNESWSDKKRVKAQIKIIETGKFLPETKQKANLYTVEIPDDNGSNYLHWDKPINGEIQERIANGLQSIGFEIEPGMNHLAYSRDGKIAVLNINAKGKDLYAELSEALGGDKAASLFLNNLGFVGISYPTNAITGGRADGARNYVIFNEDDAVIENRVEFLRTAGGNVYGWAVDGKIRLTPDGINPNTPVHEYAHLWGADVEKNNPKLWNEVVEAMKLSPVWNEVANDANYSNIHGNDSRMASEVLARLSGRENYRRTMEETEKEIAAERDIVGKVQKKGILNRIKNALKNFWNWVQRNVFKRGERSNVKAESESASEVMPWEEFANSVVGDFYKGKNPNIKESTLEKMVNKVDRDGNPIGDGSWHKNYKVDEVALSYPNISYKVDKSASTESVYVTYTNNDPKYPENERPKVTVRYSNHDSNAVKFGDQLRGHEFDESTPVGKRMAERQTNILLTRLGLKKAVPVYGKYIPNRMVSNREIEQGIYEETDKTIQEMYDLPIGTDISQYKGKVAKGSRYLIEGNEVERGQIKDYKFVDVSKKEPVEEYVVENNANFVSTYKTKDGKDIEYTSERAEGYGIQGGRTGNSYDGTGKSILQRQTDTGVPGANSGLNADKGEFCVVERVFTENGAFNFTSGEKIESADDVAYIFSALEDAAKEHSFVVYVKDGKPTVIELGMGSFNATMVDIPTASLAYSRINPDHVYFVHNHPSGNLVCSDQDVAMLRVFEDMSDVPVTGVIINLKTGKYGTFDTERHSVIGEKRVPENEERLTVHTLDKQIFAPDYDPMAQPLVRSSQDVAQFLNSQRMGDRPKVSFLILSRANRIIGNIHTPFTDISTDTEAVARYINERVIQFGGENAILYGDFAISMDESRGFRLLQGAMERFGKTKLLDVVHVEGNFTKSAIDLGLLYEPETEYNVAKENGEKYDSPEQDIPVESVQTKTKALKENAKAIRRLHNVTSRYPITALRNLGFALETQEQREMHDRLFAERDAITGESMPAGLQTNPQAMTLQELITESLLKHAEQEKENVEMRLSAIRAYGRDLANVIKLMNAQKVYDRNTVRMFTDLVKMYLRNNAMDGLSSYEIARLLNLMQRATGGREKMVNQVAVKIAEIITEAHTKQLNDIMEKQIKTGREKVNASGVVVQGGVDIIGKRVLNTYRDAIKVATEEDFKKRYDAAFARVGDLQKSIENAKQAGKDTKALENLLKEAQADADAMLLAANYRNEIKAVEEDIEALKSELSGKRDALAKGEITRNEYYESAKSINSQIVQMRAQQIDAYQKVLHALSGDIYEGVQRARAFREAEAMRVQRIHDMAENDMGGVTKSAERKEPGVVGKAVDMMVYKRWSVRAVMNGLGTYENYMKYFGRDYVDGKGELFNYFMTAFNEAQDKEWKESQNDFNILEAAARKIFGKRNIGKTYKAIARESTKGSGVILKYWDGGATVERELTIGQLMYLYMTEKQAEGQMKLRNMGLTEEKVQNAVAKLPAKYKAFADYIQTSFLPEMRPRMNEVHQRMFGASMSEVENYFPLKVNQDARKGDTDLNNSSDPIPSTITGAVIKRRVNVTPIDLMANAFDVLNEHIVDMEHWAAFAEFTRDNNTLINDNDFKNRVKNTKSIRYGDGETAWNDFVDTARIATGNYKARKDYLAKLMSGANAAKITFGGFTALKQIASLPAFLGDANVFDFMWTASTPVGWWSSWNWAIKNLPGFEERWKNRTGGNERLGENEYSIHDSRIMKAARKVGMTPNAFIDAVVVASGARAVYNTRLRFYKKLGMTEYEADRRAKNDAAISYNETQQSGQGAYLSSLQKDSGLVAMLTTLFRNSQMAFQRRVVGSMVGIGKKLARGERIREATKQKYIKMGVDEATAKKQATNEFYKSYAKDFTNLAIFGYGMNYLWVLMGQLPYLLFGDDDEEKEKIYDMAKKVGVTGMFEGFTLGNFAKGLYEKHITDGKYAVGLLEAPFEGDLQKVIDSFEKDGTAAGILQLGIILTEMNTGISPQRLIDLAAAFIDDSDGDVKLANDGVLLGLRILEAPQSQQDMLILDEIYGADAEKVKKVAERYIEYKMNRNLPFGSEDEKRVDKYANKFVETLKERVEKDYDPEDISVIYDRSSDTEKEILKKKWVEEMDKRNGTNAAKSLRKEKIEELLGSPVEKAAAKALHRFTKTNPYEKMETFEDLERWYEYDVLLDVFKKDYQRIRDEEEMTPEERAKAVEHYGVYADEGFKEVINAIKAHKKLIKENNDPEWRMGEIRRLTDIATEIMKRYE